MFRTALLLAACATANAGFAAPTLARRCVEELGAPYQGTLPPNMKLRPACAGAQPVGHGEVHWVFEGRTRIRGQLEYTGGEWGGLRLIPDSDSKSQLPSVIKSIQLEDLNGDLALRPPGIQWSSSSGCRATTVVVEFSELEVIRDDSDSSGDFVRKYAVKALGKWRKCQTGS